MTNKICEIGKPACYPPVEQTALAQCPVRHLNQVELSRRWSLSPRTLENWRWRNEGPVYLKIGGRVAYRLDDIEAYEAKQIHQPS